MQQAIARQPARADVDLQGLVDEPGLGQPRVALGAPADKVGLRRARLEVLVVRHLLGHGRGGLRCGARGFGRVVVPRVDLVGGWEGEEFGGGLVAVVVWGWVG